MFFLKNLCHKIVHMDYLQRGHVFLVPVYIQMINFKHLFTVSVVWKIDMEHRQTIKHKLTTVHMYLPSKP